MPASVQSPASAFLCPGPLKAARGIAERGRGGGRRGQGEGWPGRVPRSFGMKNLVQVVPEDLGSGRVPEFRHGLGLDLADALAGDAVDLADLVQGLGLA